MAPDRRSLGEVGLQHLPELSPPGSPHRPILAGKKVEVCDRRDPELFVAPRSLGLLEMDEVGGLRRIPHASCERATAQLAPGPPPTPDIPLPRLGLGENRHDLDWEICGDVPAYREVLSRGKRLHLDAMRHQPAKQADSTLARCTTLQERWLCENDECFHDRLRESTS